MKPANHRKGARNSLSRSLDRRLKQKMMRGNVTIERRLDLHGMSAQQAREQLKSFIRDSRNAGKRDVLIITGKGSSPYSRHTLHSADHYHAPERKARLRNLVPGWLDEPVFSDDVIAHQPAHPKHGGGGAIYVRLKRKDRPK